MLELVLRLAVSLGVVLGLFWLVARAGARKLGGSRALLKVHGRQSLSRTASVAVVEVGSRVLVVGVSEGGVRLLTELDPEDLAEPEAVPVEGTVAAAAGRTSRRTDRPRRLAAVHEHLEAGLGSGDDQDRAGDLGRRGDPA